PVFGGPLDPTKCRRPRLSRTLPAARGACVHSRPADRCGGQAESTVSASGITLVVPPSHSVGALPLQLGAGYSPRPESRARATASARDATCSFVKHADTWL